MYIIGRVVKEKAVFKVLAKSQSACNENFTFKIGVVGGNFFFSLYYAYLVYYFLYLTPYKYSI